MITTKICLFGKGVDYIFFHSLMSLTQTWTLSKCWAFPHFRVIISVCLYLLEYMLISDFDNEN